MCNLCRRHFIRGAATFGAASIFTMPSLAQPQPVAAGLPARGKFVIRNAYVMTMDTDAGDIAGGDVHVRDGEIVAVGRKLKRTGRRRPSTAPA